MGSLVLTNLPTAWHVDMAILSEEHRVVVMRFGTASDPQCMVMDGILSKVADKVKNFASIWLCDTKKIKDFNRMYELYEPCAVMFFYRNKHMLVDFGTGNNNKLDFEIGDKQEMIDLIECVYRAGVKGQGIAISPKDYSTTWKY